MKPVRSQVRQVVRTLVSPACFAVLLTCLGLQAAEAQIWQERAAEHARLLSQVKWTPVAGTMPNRKAGCIEAWKENTGVLCSSVRSQERYIGFDLGLRTFLATAENLKSVLYTEDLTGKVSNAAAFYGTVCSPYTSYALGCGIWEVSRRYGSQVSEGIVLVEPQSPQAAQVGDVIYTHCEGISRRSHD